MRVVLVLLLAACASNERDVSLRELQSGALEVAITANASRVTVTLALPDVSECVHLTGNVTATFDGEPFPLVRRGGYVPPAATDAASSCDDPMFQIATEPSAIASTISISDGSTTVSADIASLRVARAFTVGAVARGTSARFAWSVASDISYANDYTHPTLLWMPDQGQPFAIEGNPSFDPPGTSLAIEGTTIGATLPADGSTGPGMFSLAGVFGPAIATCTGIATCVGGPVTAPALRATIAP